MLHYWQAGRVAHYHIDLVLGDQGRDDTWQEFFEKNTKKRDTEEKKRSCLSDESFLMRQEIRPHVNGALLFQIPVIHWLSRGPFQKTADIYKHNLPPPSSLRSKCNLPVLAVS